MQKAKVVLFAMLLFVLVRNAGAYHRATEFNRYLQEQVLLIGSKSSLKEILLMKAVENRLPITDQNINFTKTGAELRVSVDYQMPLDLILFQKELTFHPSAIRTD